MKNTFLSLLIIAIIGLSACTDELKPDDYIKWVENENNGLRSKKATTAATYVLQYEPAEYKALKRLQQSTLSKARLINGKEKYKSMHHFVLKVKPEENFTGKDKSIMEYLAYDFEEHILFIRGNDTLDRNIMYHLESSAGVKPYYNILLAYPKTDRKVDLELQISKNKLDSNSVQFALNREALVDIPAIKMSNE